MLAGGELAARLSARERLEIIQSGGSPLNPQDVQAYMKGSRKFSGSTLIAAGVGDPQFNSMGMSKSSMNDLKRAGSEYNLDTSQLGQDDMSMFQDEFGDNGFDNARNPRESVNNKLQNYGKQSNSFEDLNDKLQDRLSRKSSSSLAGSYPNRFEEEVEEDIIDDDFRNSRRAPSSREVTPKRKLLTNNKEIYQLGMAKGIANVSAFLILLKKPSVENRNKLIDSLNQMTDSEAIVHPSLVEYYYKGLAAAEKIGLDKIKGVK